MAATPNERGAPDRSRPPERRQYGKIAEAFTKSCSRIRRRVDDGFGACHALFSGGRRDLVPAREACCPLLGARGSRSTCPPRSSGAISIPRTARRYARRGPDRSRGRGRRSEARPRSEVPHRRAQPPASIPRISRAHVRIGSDRSGWLCTFVQVRGSCRNGCERLGPRSTLPSGTSAPPRVARRLPTRAAPRARPPGKTCAG
jgi:hypothetical protein